MQVIDRKTLNKLKFGWSKYGYADSTLLKKEGDVNWVCQCCAQEQALELPSFMFEFFDGEFVRICAICQYTKITFHIVEFFILVKQCRA